MAEKDAQSYSKRNFLSFYTQKLFGRLVEQMNNYKVKKKLHILYIYCVLLPLIITDSIILIIIIHANQDSRRYELQNIVEAVKYNLTSEADNAVTIANNIYMDKNVNEFLNTYYESPLDFYDGYLKCMRNSLLKNGISSGNTNITMYVDNESIINGGGVARLENVAEADWYQYLKDSGQNIVLYIAYDDSNAPASEARRRISLIRKMNFYQRDDYEKVLKLDMDYSTMVRDMVKLNYELPFYICINNQIIFSNNGHSDVGKDFDLFELWNKVGYQESFTIYEQEMEIYVLKREQSMLYYIWENIYLILFLICINIFLPWVFVQVINRSFIDRLQTLSRTFNDVKGEKLQEVPEIRGEDEIGTLMHNYNHMASRFNELVQTIYKDKLKQQEMDIARQNAELQALHSQINPHFLFNALESIRMHSILKQEMETARMVEKLAVMERQYMDWEMDSVAIKDEVRFADAYLELQKYRFGDRLLYRMEINEKCLDCRVPKLTLVTFVENACVHGIENKPTPGWIFVRIYPEGSDLCIEIEDTGIGIREPLLSEIQNRMEHVDISSLKEKGRIGMANACLRLKMISNYEMRFELESEEGAGTIITMRVPLKYTVGEYKSGEENDASSVIGR